MAEAQQITKQSRTGKRPIAVPSSVQISLQGRSFKVKGPKGELACQLPEHVDIVQKDGEIQVSPKKGAGQTGIQYQGLTRALMANMIQGAAEGYKLSLDFRGVGYRATVKEQSLEMVVGLSHQVSLPIPEGLTIQIETRDEGGTKYPRVHLESADKDSLGQFAARVRSVRPPEPYKGKGVRYTGERIREKAGKAGKAGK
jgi:large subunit ribosomal protein L6